MTLKLISQITRTEVFYTASFHFACNEHPGITNHLLQTKLNLSRDISVKDSGFEVCLFRDFAKAGLLPQQGRDLQKQTFDNVFVLSDNSVVLLEAKVHQGFNNKQIEQMQTARRILEDHGKLWSKVRLLGLCSSEYTPKPDTRAQFDSLMTWRELSECFDSHRALFLQADGIYQN